jgi:hypothetical protein
MGSIGVFTRTPDRAKVLIASIDSDGTLCEIDESTGVADSVQIGGFIFHVSISPDGNLIVLPKPPTPYGQVDVFDAHTLTQVAQFSVAGEVGSDSGFFMSADSKRLYVPSDTIVYAYDLTTYQQIGWFPNIVVEPSVGGGAVGPISGPNIQAMDGTGLLAGPMEEGVGFLDTTAMRTGPVGAQFLNGYLNPATGPAAGGTQTSWSVPNPFSALTDVYVGSQKATSVSGSSGTISVATPPGTPGPADVYALVSDGSVQLLPQAFSYGPTVLQITPDAATTDGGIGMIYGYGFGPIASATVPSDLQVSVGGKPAAVTAFGWNAYATGSPPFPLQSIAFRIPPGGAGTADVTVTTSSGSATVHDGMSYLLAIQQFPIPQLPLSGAALAQGIYDSHRDLYYFTDATSVRVFSKAQGKWLASISIPAADTPKRLWGIALSPNGSQLAIADIQGAAIYVLNPGNPSGVKKFAVPQPGTGAGQNPVGVAISDAGIIYFGALTAGGTGYYTYFKLDPSSGQVSDYGIGTNSGTDNYLRTILSADNSRVYGNDDGEVITIDTATDKVSYAKDDPGCCYGDDDLSLSANQTRFAATGYFYDVHLNAEAYVGLNLREMMNVSYVYGEKLSPDGSLLFQPTTNGIDVLDARLGILLERIALPVNLSPNYDALVSDGKDNILVAITGNNGDGVAVIDLTSIPEPSPLPYGAAAGSAHRLDLAAPRNALSAHPNIRSSDARGPAQPGPAHRTPEHVTTRTLLHRP